MATKKTKQAFRMNAKRKVFLHAIELLGKYFDEYGVAHGDIDEMADDILQLRKAAPKSVSKSFDTFAAVCGSALYLLHTMKDLRNIEECSETCQGGAVFEAAFYAGWSMGFDAGMEFEKEHGAE